MLSTKIRRTTLLDRPKRRAIPEHTPAMTRSLDGRARLAMVAGPSSWFEWVSRSGSWCHQARVAPRKHGFGPEFRDRSGSVRGEYPRATGWQDGRVTLTTGPQFADQLDYPLLHRGKVRELYAYDDDRLLMVATDQISAFDYVLDSTIPDKGAVLTQLSQWWFGRLSDIVDNHVLSTDVP